MVHKILFVAFSFSFSTLLSQCVGTASSSGYSIGSCSNGANRQHTTSYSPVLPAGSSITISGSTSSLTCDDCGAIRFEVRSLPDNTLRYSFNCGALGNLCDPHNYSFSFTPAGNVSGMQYRWVYSEPPGCGVRAPGIAFATLSSPSTSYSPPSPPSAPTGSGGNATICSGASFNFPGRTCATGTLRWYENSAGTGTFYTGASVTPASTTTYYPFCYEVCLSTVGNSATATVITAPATPGAISGSTTVCNGTSNAYSIAAVPGATSYTWSYSGGGTPSGTGTSATLTPTSSGTLTVVANNACGSSGNRTLAITVNNVPATPGAISGSTTVCNGTSNAYSIAAVAGATSYTWSYSGGGTPSGTGTSATLIPTSSGTLTVVANNACGSSGNRTLAITVNNIPATPGAISGSNTVCSGTSNAYSVAAVAGATSYTWSYSGGGTPSGTGTSATLTPTSSGTLTVVANNACGSSGNRTLAITVVVAPTGSGGNTSVCGGASFTFPARTCASGTLRWYENAGATGPFYTGPSVTPTTTTTYFPFCNSTCNSPVGNAATVTVTCYPTVTSGSVWTWTGCNGTNWFDPCSWDRGSIPTVSSNVIVPNTTNKPVINAGTANCFDITVQSTLGATLDITPTGFLNITAP